MVLGTHCACFAHDANSLWHSSVHSHPGAVYSHARLQDPDGDDHAPKGAPLQCLKVTLHFPTRRQSEGPDGVPVTSIGRVTIPTSDHLSRTCVSPTSHEANRAGGRLRGKQKDKIAVYHPPDRPFPVLRWRSTWSAEPQRDGRGILGRLGGGPVSGGTGGKP